MCWIGLVKYCCSCCRLLVNRAVNQVRRQQQGPLWITFNTVSHCFWDGGGPYSFLPWSPIGLLTALLSNIYQISRNMPAFHFLSWFYHGYPVVIMLWLISWKVGIKFAIEKDRYPKWFWTSHALHNNCIIIFFLYTHTHTGGRFAHKIPHSNACNTITDIFKGKSSGRPRLTGMESSLLPATG